jgi:hypothetical protein
MNSTCKVDDTTTTADPTVSTDFGMNGDTKRRGICVKSKSGQHPEPINHQSSPRQQNVHFTSLQNSKTIPFIGNYIKTPAYRNDSKKLSNPSIHHSSLAVFYRSSDKWGMRISTPCLRTITFSIDGNVREGSRWGLYWLPLFPQNVHVLAFRHASK